MPVKGGDKFGAYMEHIRIMSTNASEVRVGFLAEAKYPDGTPVALIGAIQNWGAPAKGIPPRPFFSNMIASKSPAWGAALGELLVDNGYDALRALQLAGEAIAGQLRQSIIETNDPPLAESTLKSRGVGGMVYDPKNQKTFGAKPLVLSGHMLNSVDYEVKE